MPQAARTSPGDLSRKRRVLVADDNREAADSLSMVLKVSNFDARAAYGGVEAVDAACAFDPCVIILDIGMPRMNGYEAARAIRSSLRGDQTVLIALATCSALQDIRAADAAGFDVHVVKPVAGDDLVRLVHDTLRRVKGWRLGT